MIDNIWLVPFLPLLGFLINGLFGKKLGRGLISWVGCGSVGLSFLVSIGVFFELLKYPPAQRLIQKVIFPWVWSGNFHIDIGFQVDPLSPGNARYGVDGFSTGRDSVYAGDSIPLRAAKTP